MWPMRLPTDILNAAVTRSRRPLGNMLTAAPDGGPPTDVRGWVGYGANADSPSVVPKWTGGEVASALSLETVSIPH